MLKATYTLMLIPDSLLCVWIALIDFKLQVGNYMTEITLIYQKAKYNSRLGTQTPNMLVSSIGKHSISYIFFIHLELCFLIMILPHLNYEVV